MASRPPRDRTILGKFPHVQLWSGPVLYLVRFSNGVVKVGYSRQARQRLFSIATNARKMFGDVIVTHVEVIAFESEDIARGAEYRAIRALAAIASRIPKSNEHFTDVPYDVAMEKCKEAAEESLRSHRWIARLQQDRLKATA